MFLKDGEREVVVSVADKGQLPGLGRTRLARELFSGRFRPGQSLQIDRIAVEHGMDSPQPRGSQVGQSGYLS